MRWQWKGGPWGQVPQTKRLDTLPCKGGEVGACKDLEGNVFTIGSGNKGKSGDMLCTSKETYGDDACQEWLSEKQLVLQEPTYPDVVLARHTMLAQAVNARDTKMVTSLKKQLDVIEGKLLLTPTDLNLLKSQMEVDNKLKLAKFELTDVMVEVKTTADESMAFNNAWRTYRERADCLVRSREKVYSLVVGRKVPTSSAS
jgi:hypothetical protein